MIRSKRGRAKDKKREEQQKYGYAGYALKKATGKWLSNKGWLFGSST